MAAKSAREEITNLLKRNIFMSVSFLLM